MNKNVVFDMDGVLFDTETLSMKVWIEVADAWGISNMETVSKQCIGLNANDIKALLLHTYGEAFDYKAFHEQVWEWFVKEIEENGLPVKYWVRELLQWLSQNGYKIALASSSNYAYVVGNLERAGIRSFFSEIITGDMVEHSKPQPDIYLLACEKLNAKPENAYAIEDSPNGIRAAYRAGMQAVMVPDLIAPDEEMRGLSTVICRDLQKVQEFLAGQQR